MTGRRVWFRTERLPPLWAVYDAVTGLYLAGLLTEARRQEYVARAGMVVVDAPA